MAMKKIRKSFLAPCSLFLAPCSLLLILCSLLFAPCSYAQDWGAILPEIERNNTSLRALQQEVEAEKEANHVGIVPSNPEVEFNYLWGSNALGQRMDVSVSQSLPLSQVFGYQARLAKKQDLSAELRCKVERTAVLLQAQQTCINIVYCNAMLHEYGKRLSHAQTLAEAYQQKFDAGNANALEYNKVRLNLATAQGEYQRLMTERNTLLEQLSSLNGGEAIALNDSVFAAVLPPADFEAWYAEAENRSPMLQYVRQQVEVANADARLSKAEWLPELKVGYMTEGLSGDYYQGLSVGVSVPLWQNAHRVRQAKASAMAAQLRADEQKQLFLSTLRTQYAAVMGLQKTWQGYHDALRMTNSADLLLQALQAGQISMLEYMMELSIYYDATAQALAAQRDYYTALAELQSVAL